MPPERPFPSKLQQPATERTELDAPEEENFVTSEGEGENLEEQAQNLVFSGPDPILERDTAVILISDAPARNVKFPDNPVSQTQYIPLRYVRDHPYPDLLLMLAPSTC